MKIKYNPLFIQKFKNIWDYISKDNIHSANKFQKQLEAKINTIVNFPYKARKSFYYDDNDIRDYIFKGYTIPYLINTAKDEIVILDIFKWIDK